MQSRIRFVVILVLSVTTPTLTLIRHLSWEPIWRHSCFEKMRTWKKCYLDPELMKEDKEYYMPMMSRLYLNRMSSALSQIRLEDLTEADLYYNSCLKRINKKGSIIYKGFGGKTVEYEVTQKTSKDGYQGKYFRHNMNWDEGGYTHITFTDNKTFFFVPDCTFDNKRAWSVYSITPKLPFYTVKMIENHAQQLGFIKEYFTTLRYDCCK